MSGNPWQQARENISGSLDREWFNTDRVKPGNFGHEVNSDIHLQTVEIQTNKPSHQDFQCLFS